MITIDPGVHVVRAQIARAIPTITIATGLRRAGLDVSEAESCFIVRTDRSVRLQDLDGLEWLHVRRLAVDPFEALSDDRSAIDLVPGRTYDLRVVGRTRTHGDPARAARALADMGIETSWIVRTGDATIDDQDPGEATAFVASGRYGRGRSVAVVSDPVYVDRIAPSETTIP